jgi:hypothetical protein
VGHWDNLVEVSRVSHVPDPQFQWFSQCHLEDLISLDVPYVPRRWVRFGSA